MWNCFARLAAPSVACRTAPVQFCRSIPIALGKTHAAARSYRLRNWSIKHEYDANVLAENNLESGSRWNYCPLVVFS
jgi:hypothetical protein